MGGVLGSLRGRVGAHSSQNGKYLGLVEGTKVREAGMSVRRSPEYSRGI